MNPTPTTEDRIWAVISHLSSLAVGMGIVLPVIGWADQRRESNYASFQSLQALGYQSLGFTVWVLSYLVLIIVASLMLLAMLGSRSGSSQNMDPALGSWMIAIFIVLFGFFALYFLLPIIAAVACGLGKDFRYPILGNGLARYLGYNPTQHSEAQAWLNEDHEFRWVAAMGHFSVIIALWGMLVPLAALLLQRKRNFFLKFQSIQTLVFQIGTTLIYFGAGLVYLFGIFLLFATVGLTRDQDFGSPLGILGIVIFFVSLLIAFVIILLIPLLHILGQWAGYRILKSDDYRYPLVGRLVEQWISRQDNSGVEEKLS